MQRRDSVGTASVGRWFRDKDGRLQDKESPEVRPEPPAEGESALEGKDGPLLSENQGGHRDL